MYRARLFITDTLYDLYLWISLFYDNTVYSGKRPQQLIIKQKTCTVLIFGSGKVRIMGRACIEEAQCIFDNLICILDVSVIESLYKVSETVVLNLNKTNINFYKSISHLQPCTLELELFPALSLERWKPLHVNLFSTGKVVILGREAMNKKDEIRDWLMNNI